jgi:hypothetical protein
MTIPLAVVARARRRGELVGVRGIARSVSYRTWDGDDDESLGLSFQVDRYADAGSRVPPVPVLLRGYGFCGLLGFGGQVIDGEEVEVVGRSWHGTVYAEEFVNHTTGARVEAMGPRGVWRYLRRVLIVPASAAGPGLPAEDAVPGRPDGAAGSARGTARTVTGSTPVKQVGGRYDGKEWVVMHLRIDPRDAAGHPAGPVPVALRGMASARPVADGDDVEARGIWWDGTLHAQELVNHATGATVEPLIGWRPFWRRLHAMRDVPGDNSG